MNEPRFKVGDWVEWVASPGLRERVHIINGPFQGELRRWDGEKWSPWLHPHNDIVYLCRTASGAPSLIGESDLDGLWNRCPGEHRQTHEGWERKL